MILSIYNDNFVEHTYIFMSCYKFYIYTHPVDSKFTTWLLHLYELYTRCVFVFKRKCVDFEPSCGSSSWSVSYVLYKLISYRVKLFSQTPGWHHGWHGDGVRVPGPGEGQRHRAAPLHHRTDHHQLLRDPGDSPPVQVSTVVQTR